MASQQRAFQWDDAAMTAHDPGGKVRIRLDESVRGNAFLHGPNECYRTWLTREWSRRPSLNGTMPENFILWIGLNPSTADASFNDPTINREMDFSMLWDADALVKCNVMDWRATKPEMLRAPGVVPCSKINVPFIRDTAKLAQRIVCGWGNIHEHLKSHAIEVESALRADGHELWCLGVNKGGTPRHPLYVPAIAPLIPFPEVPF